MAAEAWLEFTQRWLQRDSLLRWHHLFQPHALHEFATLCLHAELIETLYLLDEPRVREGRLSWWIEELSRQQLRHPLSKALRAFAPDVAGNAQRALSRWLSEQEDRNRAADTQSFWSGHQALSEHCAAWAGLHPIPGLSEHGALLRLRLGSYSSVCPLALAAELAAMPEPKRAQMALARIAQTRKSAVKGGLLSAGLVARLSERALARIAAGKPSHGLGLGALWVAWRAAVPGSCATHSHQAAKQ